MTMSDTLQTAPTLFIEAENGIRFAYRRLGTPTQFPLVTHMHFRGNMDFWDPRLINALATKREVILFDSAGVGRSSGTVPVSFPGWAEQLIAFVRAIGLQKFDLLGFSMGGVVVQVAALMVPDMIRKLILGGTRPAAPVAHNKLKRGLKQVNWSPAPPEPILALANAVTIQEGKQAITFSFFPPDEAGEQAAEEYWARIQTRTVEPVNLVLLNKDEGAKNQIESSRLDHQQATNPDYAFDGLTNLNVPVFIANGDDDLLIPTARSWDLFSRVEDAKVILYPRAGHGFIWQFSKEFADDVNKFLGMDAFGSKL